MSALLRSISRTMSCSVKQLMIQKKIDKLHETETLLNDGLLCLLWMQFTPDFTVAFREMSKVWAVFNLRCKSWTVLGERLDSGQGVDHLIEDTICPPTHLPPRFEIDWSDSKRHRNTYWRTQSHNNILIFSNTYLLECATYISNTKVQGSGKHTYTVCMCICICMSGCVCKTHTSANSGILN